MDKHYNIMIRGKVQGVFYRTSAQARAQQLGLHGNIRNRADGSVYIEAEGKEENLRELIQWCWHGPPAAVVTELEVTESALADFSNFVVNR